MAEAEFKSILAAVDALLNQRGEAASNLGRVVALIDVLRALAITEELRVATLALRHEIDQLDETYVLAGMLEICHRGFANVDGAIVHGLDDATALAGVERVLAKDLDAMRRGEARIGGVDA